MSLAASASAAPIVTDPWVTLPGVSPTANDMATDPDGNVFVINAANEKVIKLSPEGDVLQEYSLGSGAQPARIAIDAAGIAYISDLALNSVSRIVPGSPIQNGWIPLAGPADAIDVLPDGTVYVNVSGTTAVYKIDRTGFLSLGFVASSGVGAIGHNAAGDVYTANVNGTISKIEPDGTFSRNLLTVATGSRLSDIEFRADGSWVVYNESDADIVEYSAGDALVGTTSLANSIQDIALDRAGAIYYVDPAGQMVTTLPHAGGTAVALAAVPGGGTIRNVLISSLQTFYADRGAMGTIAAMPLLPTVSSAAIDATISAGSQYSWTFGSAGGLDPVTFRYTNLPSWLTADATTATVTGTPAVAGTYTFEVRATNALGESEAQLQSIVVQPAVLPTPSPTSPSNGGGTGSGGTGGRGALASTGSGALPWAVGAAVLLAAGATGSIVVRRRTRGA